MIEAASEPPAVAVLVDWLLMVWRPTVLHAARATGIVSVAARASNLECEVIAFDAGLASPQANVRFLGHAIKVLVVDHEEHWWCDPGAA